MPGRVFRRVWKWSGLDVESLMFIMKLAAPPVIALSLYQNHAAAEMYGSLGYLLSLSTLLATGQLPRAKFIHFMVVSLIFLSVSGAVNLLALYTGIKARSLAGSISPTDSSSDQRIVCAVWLLAQIYVASCYKSAYPQYSYAALIYEIVAVVSMISGSSYTLVAEATDFIRKILLTFLTGFAITSAVSLLVKPVSCRKIVFDDMTSYLGAIQSALKAQVDYMTSVEESDMFPRRRKTSIDPLDDRLQHEIQPAIVGISKFQDPSPEAGKLKLTTDRLLAIQGKVMADALFAKREVSWGFLGADEISEVIKLLAAITQPLVGLSSIIDILDRVAKLHGWEYEGSLVTENELELVRQQTVVVKEWQSVMKMLHEPFHDMTEIMFRANQHILSRLSLKKTRKYHAKKTGDLGVTHDVEAVDPPVEKDFFPEFERAIDLFFAGREAMVNMWCAEQGVDLSYSPPGGMIPEELLQDEVFHKQRENHIQLLVLLYMRQLLRSTSQSLLELVRYVDQKASDGVLSRRRLILPGMKRLAKMIRPSHKDNKADDLFRDEQENRATFLKEALYIRRDPEHLPPANRAQRIGDILRIIPRKLRSGHSAFGFRVACAVMSLAILGFLSSTQSFFIAQRGTWAVIMIVFSMSPTAGASTFQFFYRCAGTLLALVASFTCYYIADGNASGILVLLYLWMIFHYWILVKKPKYTVMSIISAMAIVVILGYVFEEKALGEQIQPFYPPYLIGPYRFLCVIIGVVVAFIWTIFPYPITERSEVRRGTATLLHLLAKYYTISHATSLARIQGFEGNVRKKHSPGWLLDKARKKALSKTQLLITRLKLNSEMVKWQLSIGGAFPEQIYAAVLVAAERFLRSTTLLADASLAFLEPGDPAHADWLHDLRVSVASVQETSHEVASVLSVLSASIASGEPLPPLLQMPKAFQLTERLREADPTLMATAHLAEPGYGAVAVTQLASRAVEADLAVLVREIKKLVGQLDFSFRPPPHYAGMSISSGCGRNAEQVTTITSARYRGAVDGSSTREP